MMQMLKKELEGRVIILQELMKKNSFDSYIITAEEDIWYLTNITYKPEERPFFVFVTLHSKPMLVVPQLEKAHLSIGLLDCEIITYWEYPSTIGANWYDVMNDLLKHDQRTGIESNSKLEVYIHLQSKNIIPSGLIAEMRKIKRPYELELIRKSASMTDRAMQAMLQKVRKNSGIAESFAVSRGIQSELMAHRQFDILTTSLLTAVWPAPKSAMPHSIPDIFEDQLGDGPNVAMAYFRINGYAAECERTFFVSAPTREEKELFQHMMIARDAALSVLKAGIHASDVDAAAKGYLEKHGLGFTLLHRTGHGIGLGNHEAPFLAEGSDEILQENMVVSIEPGIYLDGVGGFRHSDTVLITKNGFEWLTQSARDLDVLTILSSK